MFLTLVTQVYISLFGFFVLWFEILGHSHNFINLHQIPKSLHFTKLVDLKHSGFNLQAQPKTLNLFISLKIKNKKNKRAPGKTQTSPFESKDSNSANEGSGSNMDQQISSSQPPTILCRMLYMLVEPSFQYLFCNCIANFWFS